MSKIYLDKIVDFSSTTYDNYSNIYNAKNDYLNIENIKKNISLNENALFNKYNYAFISDLSTFFNYKEIVHIYPLWFDGNVFDKIINALLLILDKEYTNDNNCVKKYKINNAMTKKMSNLINNFSVNIILLDKNINIFSQNYEKTVVLILNDNEIYPVINFSDKYFNQNSNFIKELNKNKNVIKISIDKYFDTNKKENSKENSKENLKENINELKNINNNYYEEIESSERNGIYMSECPKKDDILLIRKKNSIFIPNKIEENDKSSSIFEKTECKNISQSYIDKVKITLPLSELQKIATNLNILITNGATKTGKPKNKTKNELFDDIKKTKLK